MNFSKEVLALFEVLYKEEDILQESGDTKYSYVKRIRTNTGTLEIARKQTGYIRVTFKDIDNNAIYYTAIARGCLRQHFETPEAFVNDIVFSTDGTLEEE